MKKKTVVKNIENMPRSAYLFLRSVLQLCCVMLFASWLYFLCWEDGGCRNHALYQSALTLLETPAAVLLLGGIGTAFFMDRSSAPPK